MYPKRIEPKPGQESVWDYPRPPRLEKFSKPIQIMFNGVEIVNTIRAFRVLETTHPPVYYLPPDDIQMGHLVKAPGQSWCEWKGRGRYYSVQVGEKVATSVGWYYSNPAMAFKEIKDYVAFYAGPMERCTVDGEVVLPQPGDFYGGWITANIVGPFKGGPGSMGW
ncbi:MAG: DUF427 domain-containing protein [Calditrichia bacterium]